MRNASQRILDVCRKWYLDRFSPQANATPESPKVRERGSGRRPAAPANPLLYELFVTCIADKN
jgi:hypothetical protein